MCKLQMLSAAEMCCLTENAKARYLVEAFNNAKKSTSAAVILDDIEKISGNFTKLTYISFPVFGTVNNITLVRGKLDFVRVRSSVEHRPSS